jgi:hypothetical protein
MSENKDKGAAQVPSPEGPVTGISGPTTLRNAVSHSLDGNGYRAVVRAKRYNTEDRHNYLGRQ